MLHPYIYKVKLIRYQQSNTEEIKQERDDAYNQNLLMVAVLELAQKDEPTLKMADYLDRLEAKMKNE